MRIDLWTCAATAALLSLSGIASSANAQASGSFQATCRSIQASGGTLTADCRDPSGKYHSSSIAYTQCKGDIGNNNGTLFCNGATATSGGQGGGGRGGNGGASAGASDPASGSFRATCRNIQTSGGTLRADCADPQGRYHGSSIAFGQCRSDISNSNGMLSCNGATAVADGANNGYGDNGRDNGRSQGNGGGRDNNFSNGPGNNFGPDRRDNGPGYRDEGGPRFDGPPPPPPGRSGYDRGSQFAPGPYSQFSRQERDISDDIGDGLRSGRISRRDARDLMDQLGDIQDREMMIYRTQGRYISPSDSRRIGRDLDMLSDAVRRAARR